MRQMLKDRLLALVIWMPLVLFNGFLAWDRYEARTDVHGFILHSVSISEREDGKMFMVLHRTLDETILADFSVSLYDHAPSCSYRKSNDTIEADRQKPYLSRFLPRFNDRCIKALVAGPAIMTVTYKVGSVVFSRTVHFQLTKRAIDYERRQRQRG